MARQKFAMLTEQMLYVLMAVKEECCGTEIVQKVAVLTNQRVLMGPGTLYTILSQFLDEKLIMETKKEGRKRNYQITNMGMQLLRQEQQRMSMVLSDLNRFLGDNDV